jgi:hypothetical protein
MTVNKTARDPTPDVDPPPRGRGSPGHEQQAGARPADGECRHPLSPPMPPGRPNAITGGGAVAPRRAWRRPGRPDLPMDSWISEFHVQGAMNILRFVSNTGRTPPFASAECLRKGERGNLVYALGNHGRLHYRRSEPAVQPSDSASLAWRWPSTGSEPPPNQKASKKSRRRSTTTKPRWTVLLAVPAEKQGPAPRSIAAFAPAALT